MGASGNQMNPLLQVSDLGQSIWCDALSRGMLLSGRLKMLIDQVGLGGVTSNPAIFEKAIGDDYAPAVRQAARASLGVKAIYEALAVRDIQDAADLLRPVYEKSGGRDGFVSLEVSPALAFDTPGSIEEGTRLFHACGRDNVMIKIPATADGIPAITALIGRGIPVNVTLLFDVETYEQVALAYIAGLEQAAASGLPLDRIASVASFFVSRIDVVVDGLLAARAAADSKWAETAGRLAGKIAIANAKVAYLRFQAILASPRFIALQRRGAQPQRLLWASTGTKNPAYADVYYVEALIGPDTVNTLPEPTLAAFRDHGRAAATLPHDLDAAEGLLKELATCDIDLHAVSRDLLVDGIRLFDEAFLRLMGTLGRQRQAALSDRLPTMSFHLGALDSDVVERVRATPTLPRALFRRDATLWGRDGLMPGLGWLDLPARSQDDIRLWTTWAKMARPFRHLLLVGMGGSALSAAVLRQTFGVVTGFPALQVLDRIDGLRALGAGIDLEQTMLIVSSKSGSTVETRLLFDYFHDRVSRSVSDATGSHFVAITDKDSPLASAACGRGIPTILCETTDVGGRYSALSRYGMIPAAMMGIDVASLAERAEWMRQSCGPELPSEENPAVVLGVAIGEAARHGRNKLTFVLSPALAGLGFWLEQLIAESTGKDGRGIAPIVGESLGAPSVYGDDRLFVQIALRTEIDDAQTAALAALASAGHPVIHLQIGQTLDIGQMFYLWEMATAAASAVIGIDPFDQPDVEEGKREARQRLAVAGQANRPPDAPPALVAEGIELWGTQGAQTLNAAIAAHLQQIKPGDYVALTAYLPETHAAVLGDLRRVIRDGTRVATLVGFGPRYLHSTAQFFRGGGNQGVFFQLTMDDPEGVPISGGAHTFGALLAAQAAGDFQTLARRGRRILRLHLGRDAAAGLARLQRAVLHALQK